MKFSRKTLLSAGCAAMLVGGILCARGAMPAWMQNIEARSLIEAAMFRTVGLPSGPITIRRPPGEAVSALNDLTKQQPQQADLYSLKALEEEQKLDFPAAEADWTLFLQQSPDKAEAQTALADFYHRRHRPQDEVSALAAVGRMPSPPAEKFTGVTEQKSWQAFERGLQVIGAQALGKAAAQEHYNAWIARYPQEPGLYGRYFQYLLQQEDFKSAADLIARYRTKFPEDQVFPTKARAQLAYEQGSVDEGLAVYDKNFQPLWPAELVKNYFDLLKSTRSERKFLDRTRGDLARNPDDVGAVTRIFYYYLQQGNLQAAQQAITDYRLRKDSRAAQWSQQELYTFARLLQDTHLYPEAARYYFALYNSQGSDSSAPEKAVAGLCEILLTAPDQPIRYGSGDLSMYQDIATMDAGPGYLNGILSLILNTTGPANEYAQEEKRAVPYFHRSRAAELVALLDQRFPNSTARPALHAGLIEAYAGYGQDDAVIRAGREFLSSYPTAAQRNQVALLMADAYARTGDTKQEFAIYDAMLQELARKADGIPLGEQFNDAPLPQPNLQDQAASNGEGEGEGEDENPPPGRRSDVARKQQSALSVSTAASQGQRGSRSPEYQRVLDRYIARLVTLKELPAALTVWRQELDRNPNDPGLYEKFAGFLESNRLGTEEEAVYKRAIQQFQGKNWYHKLARWYLGERRTQDLAALSQQVLKIFSGSDLESYLDNVGGMPPELDLQFNQFAHDRFPHNLTFVRNLLGLYRTKQFWNPVAWEALLRRNWVEDEGLRNQFFEYLSSSGKLEAELRAVRGAITAARPDWDAEAKSNPAAARFIAEAELWRSHFEAGAPALAAVAGQYPAELELGRSASSVYRSLAYYDPANIEVAVRIESNLLKANPADRDTMARIGDIYSDREMFDKAAPYWNRMVEAAPGSADSYQEAATVFWDYYFFEDALRLLNLGRSKLGDNALYSYQVGAIYENQRDYPRAVDEYVKGALAGGQGGESHSRLLQLATRKNTRDAVDAATDKAVTAHKDDIDAIELRVAVLEARSRKPELAAFLNSVLDRSNSVEVLESIEAMAKDKSLENVRQHALERQAAISSDPVRRLELRYALVHFYEQKKDLAAAQHNVDALYQENPKILGVVRFTVDFYWRNKLQQRAIDVLERSAKIAYPALRTKFNYEAARKMTEAGQFAGARKILLPLLDESPYDAEYLAAVADTYARAGDQAGLRDFYLEKIKLFQKSTLSTEDRKARIAELRRGLIPALTILKDYGGGVDQYIEIINAFPEDAGLTTEAAFYAQRYQRKDQLLSFYSKTVVASPKDSRWAVVLARLQTNYEDFDSAIQTYSQAIKVRPDRTDLLTARATLEERLLRFDEAAADYANLYQLAYKDPQWMEKVAEIRARQSQPDQVVQALETALIDGRPELPGKYFAVAERLEKYGMLAQARKFGEKGVSVAGDDLLANSDNHGGARAYTRIMTRLRQQEAAYEKLQAAIAHASQLPPLTQQVAKNGIEAATNRELRNSMLAARVSNANLGMVASMKEMGSAIDRYFTPEEKLAFASSVQNKLAAMPRAEAHSFMLPLAERAGFAEIQARLTFEMLLDEKRAYTGRALETLQIRRLKLIELGQQLERAAAGATTPGFSDQYLSAAQEVYRQAGSPDNELRLLEQSGPLTNQQRERYFELLLAKDPQRLVQIAAQPGGPQDEAVNFLIAHGGAKLALSGVEARGATESPVWRPAYTAITGLYFSDSDPQIQAAFTSALGDLTIGERLAKPLDRKQVLAGDIWYYYAARYGEYLGAPRKGDPEDFLPAAMEHTPQQGAAYFSTALYYEDAGNLARATSDYQHVMELDPKRIDVHNRLAGIYWKQKQTDAALAEWKHVVEMLKTELSTRGLPETFWGDYSATVRNLASRHLLGQFQPDINEILHLYVKQNGTYRTMPLLRATLPKLESAAATALVLELATVAPERLSFLHQFVNPGNSDLHVDQEPVYRAILELAREQVHKSEGASREYEQSRLEGYQLDWLRYLLNAKQYDRLREELAALPTSMWETQAASLVPIQLKLAAQSSGPGGPGGLDLILESYRTDPAHAPDSSVLRQTATELQQAGDKQSARKILELVFSWEIENHNLTAANLLGLADIRIQAGDLEGGVSLLRRMTSVVGNPFETQDAAAALLVRTGHPAEATPFLEELVRALPWNPDFRVRLAQARLASKQNADGAAKDLIAVGSSGDAPYETRLAAARALAGANGGAGLGNKELDLIAGGKTILARDANQPFFVAARLKAAEGLPADGRIKLLRALLEDTPRGDAARIPLLKAAIETGNYYLAINAMKPYLQPGAIETAFDREQNQDEEDLQTEAESGTVPEAGALLKLPAKELAEISRDLGLAFEKTNALDQALAYLRRAYRTETDPATKSQINKEVQQIRAVLHRRATNQARQPLVHTELEQDRAVRPRVPEPAAPNPVKPRAAGAKGATA